MLLSLFLSFVAWLALRCVHNPANCSSVICLPRIAVLSSFGREISLVNITYPGPYPYYCFHAIFTSLLLLSVAIIIPCVLPFVNNKTGEIDNLSELHWEQSYLCCVQVHVIFVSDSYLSLPESYVRQTISST